MEYSREGRTFVCRFDYDASLVEELKAVLPRRCRRWSPERQAWLVHWRAWPLAERLFQEAGLMQGPFTPTRREGPCTRRRVRQGR